MMISCPVDRRIWRQSKVMQPFRFILIKQPLAVWRPSVDYSLFPEKNARFFSLINEVKEEVKISGHFTD